MSVRDRYAVRGSCRWLVRFMYAVLWCGRLLRVVCMWWLASYMQVRGSSYRDAGLRRPEAFFFFGDGLSAQGD